MGKIFEYIVENLAIAYSFRFGSVLGNKHLYLKVPRNIEEFAYHNRYGAKNING